MLAGYSTAQVALLLVALQFLVFSQAWAAAAWLLRDDRRAAAWWAGYGGLGAFGLGLIVVGMRDHLEPLRAVGNVLMLASTMALQRGLWAFTGRPSADGVHAAMLALMAALAWAGMWPRWAPLRIGVGALMWAGLYLWVAADVYRHAGRDLQPRFRALCALPLVAAALMLSWRAWRAVVSPETVLAEVNEDTVLNLGSSVAALATALVVQLMLVGLVTVRLMVRLERLSRHDPLTGLPNRRAADERMTQEAQRLRRLHGAMSVLMIDMDHFKSLNDAHGHAVGDRALQHAATVMAGRMREIDLLARWGGEEFLAVLPGTVADDALALAQRLCETLRAQVLVVDGQPLPTTATIGVATWRGEGDSVAALVSRADAALYDGKRAGRDHARLAAPVQAVSAVRSAA